MSDANHHIIIQVGAHSIKIKLRETACAQAIYAGLPYQSNAQTWGDEVYFSIPVDCELEPDAKDVVNKGEIAFWVEGACIAIGFGPTPISKGDEIRLAAKTNIWADALDDVAELRNVSPGDPISITKA